MSDPLLREMDHYVVLEPGAPERILTAAETLEWLAGHLGRLDPLPPDLEELDGPAERASRLVDTACELELAPGRSIQWYAVRLEPPA
ncbi:MAG: chlororespiratory reduction protein 7 [Synechococcaceae cyanobacterium]|nr:chlororespiratory reduction protein 7 [Synechococcaceae cyanobacterium]